MKRKLTVYLAGPINGRSDAECNDWRGAITHECGEDIQCNNPMTRDYRGVEDTNYKEIVELDKLDIERSDILLVYHDTASVGTAMEVLHASKLGRPVIVMDVSEGPLSPWLKYHATAIFKGFNPSEVVEAIRARYIKATPRTAHITYLHGACPYVSVWDYYTLTVEPYGFLDSHELQKVCDIFRGRTCTQEEMHDGIHNELVARGIIAKTTMEGHHGQNGRLVTTR